MAHIDVSEKISRENGYLLAEYLVSVSLLVVVILTLSLMLSAVSRTAAIDKTAAELQYSGRSAMQGIKSDILAAETLQVLNNGHTLKVVCDAETVLFYIENHQLYRDGSVKLPVAENAESICFRMVVPGLVEVLFESGSAGRTYLMQSAFAIRCCS